MKLLLIVLLPGWLFSQTLIVENISGSSSSHSLADVLSIKFSPSEMLVNLNNGTASIYDIEEIDFYKIELGSTDLSGAEIEENVNIFPNPATEVLNINFSSNYKGEISVQIIDNAGRLIDQVFVGNHSGETQLKWHFQEKQIVAGQYFCVITSSKGRITKPITIK